VRVRVRCAARESRLSQGGSGMGGVISREIVFWELIRHTEYVDDVVNVS
jgi:hypothetical protein